MIDNKSFIDEKNNVFTIVNSLPLKQIQTNHKERLIEIRKSDKELQCVSPQINLAQLGFPSFTWNGYSEPRGWSWFIEAIEVSQF